MLSVCFTTTAKNTSVIAKPSTSQFIEKQIQSGNIEIFELGSEDFKKWKCGTREGTVSVTQKIVRTGKNALEFKVKIDRKTDGSGEVGRYPVGWPRIEINFPESSMDMSKYNYLSMWVMVDSDRNKKTKKYTHLALTISSWDKKAPRYLYKTELLGTIAEKKWLPILIPIKEIITKQGLSGKAVWENIKKIQIFLAESRYGHGNNVTFYIDDISLLKINKKHL